MVSGLSHAQAETLGDGNGDHTRGTATWLNGVHPKWTRRRGRAGRHDGRSNRRRRHFGKDTRAAVARTRHRPELRGRQLRERLQLRLYELRCRGGRRRRRCRSRTTRAWSSSGSLAKAAPRRSGWRRCEGPAAFSIRCSTRRPRCCRRLGAADRSRVSDYFEALREVERRIQKAEAHGAESPLPAAGALRSAYRTSSTSTSS